MFLCLPLCVLQHASLIFLRISKLLAFPCPPGRNADTLKHQVSIESFSCSFSKALSLPHGCGMLAVPSRGGTHYRLCTHEMKRSCNFYETIFEKLEAHEKRVSYIFHLFVKSLMNISGLCVVGHSVETL